MTLFRYARTAAVLSLLTAVLSCKGCHQEGPETSLGLVPQNAAMVVEIKNLKDFSAGLGGFIGKLTEKGAASLVKRTREGLSAQFGFDPFDPKTWAGFGFDADGGLVAFTEGNERELMLIFRLSDQKAFDTHVRDILKKTDGADQSQTSKVGPYDVVTVGRPFGGELAPAMHWAYVGPYVVLARPDGRPTLEKMLQRLIATPKDAPNPSISSDATYQSLLAKVAKAPVTVFLRGSAVDWATGNLDPAAAEAAKLSRGAALSIDFSATGFSTDAFVSVEVPGFSDALKAEPAAGLEKKIANDALVYLVSRQARPEAVAALKTQPAAAKMVDRVLAPLGAAVGLDPEKEILPLLSGPIVASVHVLDLAGVPEALKKRRSLAGLIDFVHVVLRADVKDPQAFLDMLRRSQKTLNAGKGGGISVQERTSKVGDQTATIFEPSRSQPARLGWAIVGNEYVYAVGVGRMDQTLAEMTAPKNSLVVSPNSAPLLQKPGASVAVFRAASLATNAQGLAGVSAGLGAGAIVGTAMRILESMGDVAFSAAPEEGGLRLQVRETLQ